MADDMDDSLEKLRELNPALRRAVKEGNLEIGMNAAEQVNTVLRNLDRYEGGLMKRVQGDIDELEAAINEFRNLVDLDEDEIHDIEGSRGRWSRVTLYLDFLDGRVEQMEQKRREEAEKAKESGEDEDEADEEVREEIDVDIRNLRNGQGEFAAPKDLDLSDYSETTYGLNGVIFDLNKILKNTLKPVAGEIEEEENELYDALKRTVKAIEDASETHSQLLEIKKIIEVAEEDDELLEELENKDADSKIKEQIERDIKGTGTVEDEFKQLDKKESEMLELIKEAHELVEHQVEIDQEFLSIVDNELGRKKFGARFLDFRNSGLYRKLRSMEGKSENLNSELNDLEKEFDQMRKILDEVMKRKQSEEMKEEKVLSEVEQYLSEYSEMES